MGAASNKMQLFWGERTSQKKRLVQKLQQSKQVFSAQGRKPISYHFSSQPPHNVSCSVGENILSSLCIPRQRQTFALMYSKGVCVPPLGRSKEVDRKESHPEQRHVNVWASFSFTWKRKEATTVALKGRIRTWSQQHWRRAGELLWNTCRVIGCSWVTFCPPCCRLC